MSSQAKAPPPSSEPAIQGPSRREPKDSRAAETEISQTLSLELSAEAWDALEVCLERFNEAWREAKETPPQIAEFLPDRPALRQVAVVELVKLDMEHRYTTQTVRQPAGAASRTTLEEYAASFPELGGIDRLPVELIYEEYLVRRQLDPALQLDEYYKRYPRRAMELKALAAVQEGPIAEVRKTTSITSLRRPDSVQVGERVDDFDLLAMLGQGSFAKVFLARQISMQRLVALKISAARGFESQTLAQLDHPNIVRVHDQRRLPERNLQLLYMQYIPGGTLSDVVQRVKRTPPDARSSQILLDVVKERLAEQGEGVSELSLPSAIRGASWSKTVTWLGLHLASALDHAHARGVLHRDLKPANVLLGRDGNPWLADFNVSASTVVASHVSAAYFGGSLAYMSPEQLDAFSAPPEEREGMMDARSDIFSLGVLLWEVLTGARPYRDEQISDLETDTMAQLAMRRRSGPTPEDWAMLAAQSSPGLVEFFRKCLAARPEDRYESAAAARRALSLCGNEASRNLLQPRIQGMTTFCRKRPFWPLFIAGVAPSVLGSIMNVPFNKYLIVAPLASEAVNSAFNWSMWIINPIAYLIGIVAVLRFSKPVRQASSAAKAGVAAPLSIRRRAVWLGEVVAWITAALWVISGPVFPLMLSRSHISLGYSNYIYFIASQAICGLLSASLAFTFTAILALRALLPTLIDADRDDPETHESLVGLSRRSILYEFAAYAVAPLAGIVVLLGDPSQARAWFVGFFFVGVISAVTVIWLKRRMIDPDIAALRAATMIEEELASGTQSALGTTSRRS